MKFYFNTTDGALSRSLSDSAHVSANQKIKRGDNENVEVIFHEDGKPVDLDPSAAAEALKFGSKVPTEQDGSYVFYSGTWVKSNGTVFTDAVTVNESVTLTSASAVFNSGDEGKVVTGAGIPSGTTIQAVVNETTATLSQEATSSSSGVTITIRGRETVYTCAPSFNTTKGNNLLGFDPEGFAEVTEVRTIAGDTTGVGFKLYDAAGSVGVWIDLDNAGATIPSQAAACTRPIEITTIATGDTAAQKATKIAAAIDADAAFSATASGDLVTITDAAVGTRTAAADFTTPQATGFGVSTWIEGSVPNSATNVASFLLDAEIEYVALGRRKSSQTFPLELDADINQGDEGVPTNATPAYPDPDDIVTANSGTGALISPTAATFRTANGILGASEIGGILLAVDALVASQETPQDTALTKALAAGSWQLEVVAILSPENSTMGAKVGLNYGTATMLAEAVSVSDDTTAFQDAGYSGFAALPFGAAVLNTAAARISATVTVATTSTITFQFAQATSDAGELTLKAGSVLTWRKLS